MPVLSRKRDEKIMVGEGIAICAVDIRGEKVRLGIEAPNGVAIRREEVFNAIKSGAVRDAYVAGKGKKVQG